MRRKPSMPAAFITNGFPIALRTNGSPCHLIPLPPFGRKDTKSLKVGIRASQRSSSTIPPKTSSKVVSIGDNRTVARPFQERRGSHLRHGGNERSFFVFARLSQAFQQRSNHSSGSTLIIAAPRLLPTQKVGGFVELSTFTRRMFVALGRRYSTVSPVLVFTRTTRSLFIPPAQDNPGLSAIP